MPITLLLLAVAADPSPSAWERIDYPGARHQPVTVAGDPVATTVASRGTAGEPPLTLPRTPPPLTANHSAFSPLFRARDVLDATRWPARTVAKLFRLLPDDTRSGTACTAEFVAPRLLVTAAHCIVDRGRGQAYAGFEVAVRYDAGTASGGSARVTRAWLSTAQFRAATPATAMVTADRCDDIAVIEIAQPLGAATGWLALGGRPSPDGLLHRFSYPQQSEAEVLGAVRDKPETGAQVRAALDTMIARARTTEPDFSPRDLYYDYGRGDRLESSYVADTTGYSLPGRSGSALLDDRGAIVAILSRSYRGTLYNCRPDAGTIRLVAALARERG